MPGDWQGDTRRSWANVGSVQTQTPHALMMLEVGAQLQVSCWPATCRAPAVRRRVSAKPRPILTCILHVRLVPARLSTSWVATIAERTPTFCRRDNDQRHAVNADNFRNVRGASKRVYLTDRDDGIRQRTLHPQQATEHAVSKHALRPRRCGPPPPFRPLVQNHHTCRTSGSLTSSQD